MGFVAVLTACANSNTVNQRGLSKVMEVETQMLRQAVSKDNAIEPKMRFHAAIIRKKAPVEEEEKGNITSGKFVFSDLPKSGYYRLIYIFFRMARGIILQHQSSQGGC